METKYVRYSFEQYCDDDLLEHVIDGDECMCFTKRKFAEQRLATINEHKRLLYIQEEKINI